MPSDPIYRSVQAKAAVFADYEAALAAWPVAHEDKYVETSYGRTHLVVCGSAGAPPVVLLHGGGGSAVDWRFNVADLAAHFHVYLVDIVGEPGKSQGARPSYKSRGHVAWLDEVRRALGLVRFRIAGASLGSWVAWQYALKFPERVTHLAVISPPNLARMRMGFLLKAIRTAAFPTDANIRKFQLAVFSPATKPPAEQEVKRAITRWRAQRSSPQPIPPATDAELKGLPQHARVLVGEDEPLYEVGAAVARFQKWGILEMLKVIPAAGHALPYEQAALVNQELIRLFESDSVSA